MGTGGKHIPAGETHHRRGLAGGGEGPHGLRKRLLSVEREQLEGRAGVRARRERCTKLGHGGNPGWHVELK